MFYDFQERKRMIKSTIRRRKAALYGLLERQREQLQEGGKHLIWKRKNEQSIKYDVIMIFSPKGYQIMEPMCQLLNEFLPQLIVDKKAHSTKNEEAFYITAHHECLLETASLMGFKYEGTIPSQLRQTIIKHYLNNLRWFHDRFTVNIDMKNVKLSEGEAIISKLIKFKYIKQILPLHSEEDLSKLRKTWVSSFLSSQPLNEICQYFGIKIAIYFAFLGYYTWALFAPALFGVFITIFSNSQLISDACILIFSIFIVFWSSIYLQGWNKYCEQLTEQWGNFECDLKNYSVRPQFNGDIIRDEITGEYKLHFPEWKRNLFFYCVTIPIIALSLLLVFLVMLYSLHFQTWWDNVLIERKEYPQWTSFLPKIILACTINLMDAVYNKIAIWLNNKENYEHEEVHENHLIIKLVLFQFVNSFLSLFYIAFYIGDMDKLKYQLAALLITRQVIGNVKESLWPFLTQSYKLSESLKKEETSQAEVESSLYCYESTFEDYLELYIQFGYVTLFSSAFPLAAICALLNNVIEVRSDAFKLCVTYQRPFCTHSVQKINIWGKLFNYMVYISIVVNCALIGKSGQLSRIFPLSDDVHICIACVILEHIMIAVKLATERTNVIQSFDILFRDSLTDNCDNDDKEA
ncbi:anoctamin-8-like protein [Leptotrombidium deliense]|uniref:Anoctamin n=1 Tax=Leptotrombidium deliense TaxID=299467 RepID=A0A443SI59_9ACAR|nr:anoctamin-8-like protein [Leptotrombidium deliense]